MCSTIMHYFVLELLVLLHIISGFRRVYIFGALWTSSGTQLQKLSGIPYVLTYVVGI